MYGALPRRCQSELEDVMPDDEELVRQQGMGVIEYRVALLHPADVPLEVARDWVATQSRRPWVQVVRLLSA